MKNNWHKIDEIFRKNIFDLYRSPEYKQKSNPFPLILGIIIVMMTLVFVAAGYSENSLQGIILAIIITFITAPIGIYLLWVAIDIPQKITFIKMFLLGHSMNYCKGECTEITHNKIAHINLENGLHFKIPLSSFNRAKIGDIYCINTQIVRKKCFFTSYAFHEKSFFLFPTNDLAIANHNFQYRVKKRKPISIRQFLALSFGLLLCCSSFFYFTKGFEAIYNSVETTAVVTGLTAVTTNDFSESYNAILKYTYNGKTYKTQAKYTTKEMQKGSQVKIKINPNLPEEIYGGEFLAGSVILTSGVLFLLGGILAYKYRE